MASTNQRRGRAHDRAARQKAKAQNAISFWGAFRDRYAPEVAAAADAALNRLTLRDLRAIEAAELVSLDLLLADTASHKQRAVIRNAQMQIRKNLRALVIAESPTMDPNAAHIVLPEGMAADELENMLEVLDGVEAGPLLREARDAEERAAVEGFKVELLDEVLAGAHPPTDDGRTNRLASLGRYAREDLLAMRDAALVARLKAEQTASTARARLQVEVEAGRPIYEGERESFTDDDESEADL
jgi:hypothetical protein